MKELSEAEQEAKKALQLMPRYERARVQDMQAVYRLAGRLIKRQTRRYWSVDGTLAKLDKAVEMVIGP